MGLDSSYVEWPSGWSLVLTDIRGSTRAIHDGRYKEVNIIGAASIAAYVKCAGTQEVPFVFGGDGATLLVPNSLLPKLLNELKSLQRTSAFQFSLDLRVGLVDVDVLKRLGQQLRVAKYELSEGNYLAQFTGGAVSLAESLVKSNDPQVQILNFEKNHPEGVITGISCRLQPIRSKHGQILSLLCKPRDEKKSTEVIAHVVEKLSSILDSGLKTAAPVREESLKWPLVPTRTGYEAALSKGSASYLLTWVKMFLWALISNLSLRFGFKMGGFIPQKYRKELLLNSDFKKFDETLRMVLDCTNDQIAQIQTLFEELHRAGLIYYGLHISGEALMTCMVQSPTKNRHIHFIDGASGGYAMAAVQMKNQIKNTSVI